MAGRLKVCGDNKIEDITLNVNNVYNDLQY